MHHIGFALIALIFAAIISVGGHAEIGGTPISQSFLSLPYEAPSRSLEVLVEKTWDEILIDKTPIASETEFITPRKVLRKDYLCHTQCFCIAERMVKALTEGGVKASPVFISSLEGGVVVLANPQKKEKRSYLFHVITLVETAPGHTAVLDPIVFGDQHLHPVDEWKATWVSDLKKVRFLKYERKLLPKIFSPRL